MDLWTMGDLTLPWCLRVVATLKIAEHIAAGITRADDLAAAAQCDCDVLCGVLDYLVSKGVFEKQEPDHYSLNEAASGLLDPALHLGLDLEGIGSRMAYAWGTLLNFVRTGTPAYHEVFGMPFWEDLDAHPEVAASFDAMIGPLGHGSFNPEFELTGGWETVRSVVDVGGGTGAMLAAILRARPAIHGTLLDLAKTVARSDAIFDAAGVAGRVTRRGQSFFDPLPAGADVYLLRGVLNNWPDREATTLLSRCAEAAGPSGRVVILKSIGPDGGPREITIDRVLLGGKQRTVAEFRKLAQKSGLEIVAAGKQPSGYFVVECTPASSA